MTATLLPDGNDRTQRPDAAVSFQKNAVASRQTSLQLVLASLLGTMVGGGMTWYAHHVTSVREDLHAVLRHDLHDWETQRQKNIVNILEHARRSLVAIGSPAHHASGFFISDAEYIMTNHHVIHFLKTKYDIGNNGQFPITIYQQNRGDEPYTFSAEIAKNGEAISPYAGGSDLVVLRVPALIRQQLPSWVRSMTFRDVSARPLQSGETVVVVGNPCGHDASINIGHVGHGEQHFNDGRTNPLFPVVQVDANANKGNSGGILMDEQGELVGVPFSISGPGLTFARHVLNLKVVLEQFGIPVSISPQERDIVRRWQREYDILKTRAPAQGLPCTMPPAQD
ncbi:trypsin-like peptidase domain-containing protein [Candidatus Peregrinibacteria bacterium]|nr:trypsin-like peptidase domain-containing protein [Candidatus Peregrinibacteria bacterium]